MSVHCIRLCSYFSISRKATLPLVGMSVGICCRYGGRGQEDVRLPKWHQFTLYGHFFPNLLELERG